MTSSAATRDERNITMLEIDALRGGVNVSDGHPRMPLTESQQLIVEGLPQLFEEAWKRPFEEIEAEAQRAFLHGLGQHSAPISTGRLLSCYSSSVAMDLVARTLAQRGTHVALVHPTFDNIPDLLKARNLMLVPLPEADIARGAPELGPEVVAVFVTSPNNPTGWVLDEEGTRRLARFCAETGRVLVFDSCFRAQDERAQYDAYRILEDSGTEWVIIEDTGKLWPTLELKAGFLAWGEGTRLELFEAFSDVLLSISPLVLLLITRLAEDAGRGGYAQLRGLLQSNRQLLAGLLADTPLTVIDPGSRISVARVAIPSELGTALQLHARLVERDVHTLPCDAFHWADHGEGRQLLRVALARSADEVERAGRVLVDVVNSWAGRD